MKTGSQKRPKRILKGENGTGVVGKSGNGEVFAPLCDWTIDLSGKTFIIHLMSLTIETKTEDSITLLYLSGRIDANNAPEAEKQIFEHLKPGTKLAVGFENLSFISSAGLRIFLMLAKKSKAQGGSLALFALPDLVKDVFEISGFSRILTICDTQEEAVAKLS